MPTPQADRPFTPRLLLLASAVLLACGQATAPQPKVESVALADANADAAEPADVVVADLAQPADLAAEASAAADVAADATSSCTKPADCPQGLCVSGKCLPKMACQSDKSCTELGLVCDLQVGYCVACVGATDCLPNQVCKAHQCQDKPKACTTSKDCLQGQVCDKTALLCVECASPSDCGPGLVCVANACQEPICIPGAKDCANQGTAKQCNSDGSAWQEFDCPDASVCVDGDCAKVVCSAAKKFCQGTKVMVCDATGTAFSLSIDCLAISSQKMVCEGGQCVPEACTPGQTLCMDAKTQASCKTDSSVYTNVACAPDAACENDACKPLVCPPGKTYCDGVKVMTCSALGTWSQLVQDCGAQKKFCAAGACTATAPVCTAGAKQCIGASLQTCNPDGSGWSTASCDDANACTDDVCTVNACIHTANSAPCGTPGSCSACKGGACVAGPPSGLDASVDTGAFEEINDALPDGAGNLVAAGWHIAPGTAGAADVQSGWLVKLSSTGNQLWSKTFAEGQLFRGLGPSGNGWLAWGRSDGASPWFVRTDADGKALWSKNFDCADCNMSANAGVVSANATYVCGASGSSAPVAYCLCIDPDGGKLWQQSYGDYNSFQGLAQLTDGSLLVVGDTKKTSVADSDFAILRLTPSGAVVWKQVLPLVGPDIGLGAVATTDGVIALARLNGDSKKLVLMKYSADGKQLWSQNWLTPQVVPCGVSKLIASGDDGVLMLGTNGTYEAGTMKACAQRVDAGGALSWSRVYKNPSSMLLGGVKTADGFALVGAANFYNTPLSDGLLLKTSPSGVLGCQCAADAECDDKMACTVDACNVGLCRHDPAKVGAACSGGQCDGKGACVKSP